MKNELLQVLIDGEQLSSRGKLQLSLRLIQEVMSMQVLEDDKLYELAEIQFLVWRFTDMPKIFKDCDD